MNTNVARLTNPSELWMFQDEFILETLSRIATRILIGAAAGLPEYPAATTDANGRPVIDADGNPALAREVVILADGARWLYADEVNRPIITPGAIADCHKCGDRGRIEGIFNVGWRNVVVEFAYCVGCMASQVKHVTQAPQTADSLSGVPVRLSECRWFMIDYCYEGRELKMTASSRTMVRHAGSPMPNACRWCGKCDREHSTEWVASVGFHKWVAPTPQQRRARMLARRASSTRRV